MLFCLTNSIWRPYYEVKCNFNKSVPMPKIVGGMRVYTIAHPGYECIIDWN